MMPKKEIHWKPIDTYKKAMALLTSDQLSNLSCAFLLSEDQLVELRRVLIGALYPGSGGRDLIETLESQKKGRCEIESALQLIDEGCLKLEAATAKLTKLDVYSSKEGEDHSLTLKSVIEHIQIARAMTGACYKLLRRARDQGAEFTLNVPPDARRRPNAKRTTVCFALIRFWLGIGNEKAGYSTNAKRPDKAIEGIDADSVENINGNVKQERTGPLINFIGYVVDCITDPPANLAKETIRSEIRAANAQAATLREYDALLGKLEQDEQGS